MTDKQNKPATSVSDEMVQARAKADEMGIKYSGNTGLNTLTDKIQAALDDEASKAKDIEDAIAKAEADKIQKQLDADAKAAEKAAKAKKKAAKKVEKAAKTRAKLEEDELAEIQVAPKPVASRFTNAELIKMDAKKYKDPALRRQIIRAQALRMVRVKIQNLDPSEATVPGGIITVSNKYTGKISKFIPYSSDEPYHIQQILLNHLQGQKFVLRKEIPGGKFGVKKYKTTYARKFAIEVLVPLTSKELKELAANQKASGSIS